MTENEYRNIRAEKQLIIAKAERAKQLNEEFIKPFIESKHRILFNAFVEVDANDTDRLQLIRLQSTALSSLEAELQTYIDSGKIAKHELESMK